MSDLIKDIDARTSLAGTNRVEVLQFGLGREEIYGINVFKIKEVLNLPEVTYVPGAAHPAVKGIVSLRQELIPVISLNICLGLPEDPSQDILLITEYSGKTQGFIVSSVDTIYRLSWADMKEPPHSLGNSSSGTVLAIALRPDGKLIQMLDVEKILATLTGDTGEANIHINAENACDFAQAKASNYCVLYADDSPIARKRLNATLTTLGLEHREFANGKELLAFLEQGKTTADLARYPLVITDIEMPELDGFQLTKRIKSDAVLRHIKVIMHSSLSSQSNKLLGESAGADRYIAKFDANQLAQAIKETLNT